jgi:hypothetical protein
VRHGDCADTSGQQRDRGEIWTVIIAIDIEAVQSRVAQSIAIESIAHHLLRELELRYNFAKD